MKAAYMPTPPPPVFQPRTVTLTFESQQELDALGTLFNTYCVCRGLWDQFGFDPYSIRAAIRRAGGSTTKDNTGLADAIRRAI